MKKLLLFALLSIVLFGCADGVEDKEPIFIGETFIHRISYTLEYHVTFISETEYRFTYKNVSDDRVIESYVSTYTFSNPYFMFYDFGVELLREDKAGEYIDDEAIKIGNAGYFNFK